MHLLIDGRPLQAPVKSGIPRLTRRLIEALAEDSAGHLLTVFTAGLHRPTAAELNLPAGVAHYHLGWPNKLLHLSLWLWRWPKLDTLAARASGLAVDHIFLPNFHFFAARAPFTLLVHDLSFWVLPAWYPPYERFTLWLKRARTTLKEAARILAVSQATAGDLKFFCEREADQILDLRQLLTPATNPAVTPSAKAAAPFPFSYFLMLGPGERRKNLQNSLRAFQIFLTHRPASQARLVIAGAETAHSRKLKKEFAGLGERVLWLGTVSDEARQNLLGGAKALLYPSFYEGYGLPLLEAEAWNLPVITSAGSATAEVPQGKTYFINPERPESMAVALAQLLD